MPRPPTWPSRRIAPLIAAYRARWSEALAVCDARGRADDAVPAALRAARAQAIAEALRWGDPCFVAGPGEDMLWAVPLMLNAEVVGGLVAQADSGRFAGRRVEARAALADLRRLAEEANLCNAALLLQHRQQGLREQARADAIRLAKGGGGGAEVHAAYLQEEGALVAAIRRGDDGEARRILNRVLVVVYGRAGDDLGALKAFALELVTTMVRTAVEGGAPLRASVAGLARLAELNDLEDLEAVSRWLAATMRDLMTAIRAARRPPADQRLDEALRILRERHGEALGRDQVARLCRISPAHFSRLFRARHGRPFGEALARIRCEAAAALLAQGDESLAGIALACGFADQSHFGKVFRRCLGATPRAYRQRMQA